MQENEVDAVVIMMDRINDGMIQMIVKSGHCGVLQMMSL